MKIIWSIVEFVLTKGFDMDKDERDLLSKEIEEQIGRVPILIGTTQKAIKGFIPLYFDFNEKHFTTKTFAKTELECLKNFKQYLEGKHEREDARDTDQD